MNSVLLFFLNKELKKEEGYKMVIIGCFLGVVHALASQSGDDITVEVEKQKLKTL